MRLRAGARATSDSLAPVSRPQISPLSRTVAQENKYLNILVNCLFILKNYNYCVHSRHCWGCRMECPYATHNSYDERKTLGGLSRLVKPKVRVLTQPGPECAADLERVVATRKMRLMINS